MKVRRTWALIAKHATPERQRRFWARVDKRGPDECWPWVGPTDRVGYGAYCFISHEGPIPAHRIAYGLANGGIPDGLHVLHKCDNRPCCNPAHLYTGTHTDNMADMRMRGRAGWQKRNSCACGNEKLVMSRRCEPCQRAFARVRDKARYQRRHRAESERRQGARLERLRQVAIRCPATRSGLVEAVGGDARRAEVMIRFFGLYGQPAITLTEIGRMEGLSRERIRQMRNEALRTLGLAREGQPRSPAVPAQDAA